jgi:hypothetical protein
LGRDQNRNRKEGQKGKEEEGLRERDEGRRQKGNVSEQKNPILKINDNGLYSYLREGGLGRW